MSAEQERSTTGAVMPAVQTADGFLQTLEAMIFASDEPLSSRLILTLVEDSNRSGDRSTMLQVTAEDIEKSVDELNRQYEAGNRSYRIIRLAGGFTFATDKKFAAWIGKLYKEKARRRLSTTAVETLAIIAYKQPITKTEVEFIRGVNSDYIMKALLEKNLVSIIGRATTPGRPLLYGTTPDFLMHFGLNEISDLPKPREISELIGETELEVEKRLLAEQQDIEFKEELGEKHGIQPRQKTPRHRIPVAGTPEVQLTGTNERGAVTPPESKEIPSGSETPSVLDIPAPVPIEEERAGALDVDLESGSEIPQPEPAIPLQTSAAVVPPPSSIESVIDGAAVPFESEPTDPIGREARAQTAPASDASDEMTTAETSGSEKGWSRWKTKIQLFFRKLFG